MSIPLDRDHLIDFLEDLRRYYGVYHNHKETCAWAGLVFHAAFCGLMTTVGRETSHGLANGVFALLVILVEAVLTTLYLRWQFLMKDEASSFVASATAIQLQIISREISDERLRDFIAVEESGDLNLQSSHFLPSSVLKKAKALNVRGRGAQTATRTFVYIFVWICALAAITTAPLFQYLSRN